MEISRPYLLFLGDVPDALAAKTGLGIVDWRRDWCVGQWRLPGCKADAKLPEMNAAEGADAGAKTMIVGVVNAGGKLPEHWISSIEDALAAGMDVAAGLHQRLADIPRIAEAAKKHGRKLLDVRRSTENFETGKGTKRPGLRLLTVGTDCSVGKKYTALALEAGMQAAGLDARFCATGQTGVFISGRGAAIDAVVADFISGAAEWLSPATEPATWQLVEGQGSLFHPSFAGVSLGLLHGAQPDAFVVCHEPTRTNMRGVAHPLPTIAEVIEATIAMGKLTNPAIRPVGIAINTAALAETDALETLEAAAAKHDLPATDPVRFGVDPIVKRIMTEFPS
ncbi:N-acetyltransferase DgcN [Acuticoccus sp. MNP-M23]|uniref:N-acetyltransferase DgcN n=1 Tax=Acuticoccus sp. MNP-M23 TaxID=3072793 RepID=UPI0028154A99|nr:N-acetyltransferase DgcN [Acuticoccus sp. MNP-M23]WMS41204.1 N-acetyltransferase DgcN [Acuticoccus sp. MNP-M23]